MFETLCDYQIYELANVCLAPLIFSPVPLLGGMQRKLKAETQMPQYTDRVCYI
jgi:hypothetical protein